MRTKYHDIHFAAGELNKSVKLLVKVFLTGPDAPLMSGHSAYLAPYYSLTIRKLWRNGLPISPMNWLRPIREMRKLQR